MTIEPGRDGLRLTKGTRAMKDEADLRAENERLRSALETLQREHLTCTPLRRANVIDRALSGGTDLGGRKG